MSVDAHDSREALFVLCLVSPPQAVKEWIPDDDPDLDWFNRPRTTSNPDPDGFDQSPAWQAPEIQLDDGRTLVLEYT